MKKLTEVIVRRPVAAIVIMAAIVIFGAMALFSMPQELTPEMEMPMLIVSTVYPGAGPEDVEKLVSKEIEDAVGSLSGIKKVSSRSMENVSLIIIQYEYGTDIDTAYTNVKEKLDGIVNRLPKESRTPVVMEMDINAMPTMTLSVTSDNRESLLSYVDDEIVPQLEKLSAISQVSVSGGREEYIRVEVKEEMLGQYGIAISSVIAAVSNVDYSAPLGSAGHGDQDLSVRTQVKYGDAEAMRNIPITLRSGDTIRLSDVANIYEATKDADSISRYNGKENISLNIQKRQSASAGKVSKDVTKVIGTITQNDPDLHIAVVDDNSDRISSSISSIASTMIMAIVLSMLVLFVFFGDIRASVIVGSSMPISLLVTFILMNVMGFSLNVVSMSGLVLGVGMMVDNAIVVIDSCFKSKTHEKSFMESAVEGTGFVMLSIFAGTLTTVVVFLPLAAISGMSGQLFGPLGFSIVFSLTASLFSAITLVPLFFVQFKPQERRKAPAALFLKKVERGYAKILRKILKKKKTVLAATAALLALCVYLATLINVELMPSSDEGIIAIAVETKPGIKLERIDDIMAGLEEMAASHPDVERYTLTSGGSGLQMMGGGGGSTTLTAYLLKKRQMETSDVIEQWRRETKYLLDCDIDISRSSSTNMSFSSGNGFDIVLKGDNFDTLKIAAAEVETLIKQHPDIIRVSSSIDNASPQAEIVVDPLKAASKNLSPQLVTASVYTALNGSEAAEIRIDRQKYSVWVEYPKYKYQSVSDLTNMMVTSATGASIPLSEVAVIEFSESPQTIAREEGQYVVTISSTPTNAAKYTAKNEIESQVNGFELPAGVSIGQSTQAEMMGEEFTALGMAIITAVLLVFMVMAIQFESIRHSLMVMTCIPFSAIGSLGLMYLTRTTLSMVALLGFLILVGTVVNNGILYVDTVNQYRRSMDLETALIHTGRTRLRPILMTTLTTVLSMIPLAAGIGEGTEMMQGLGITVIGGLSAATLLTLLLLPTFYLIIDGNPEKREERKRKNSEKREKKLLAEDIGADTFSS